MEEYREEKKMDGDTDKRKTHKKKSRRLAQGLQTKEKEKPRGNGLGLACHPNIVLMSVIRGTLIDG